MARRKEVRRQQLLEAAMDLFGARGYHATTVPEIVAQAGSSTGSFYFYFKNKEDIFSSTLELAAKDLTRALNRVLSQQTDILRQMKAAIETTFLYFAEHPAQARILLVESSGLTPALEEQRRAIVEGHARGVKRGLEAAGSRISAGDPNIAAQCWVGAVYESARCWLETPEEERVPARSAATAVAEFNLRAVGAPAVD